MEVQAIIGGARCNRRVRSFPRTKAASIRCAASASALPKLHCEWPPQRNRHETGEVRQPPPGGLAFAGNSPNATVISVQRQHAGSIVGSLTLGIRWMAPLNYALMDNSPAIRCRGLVKDYGTVRAVNGL